MTTPQEEYELQNENHDQAQTAASQDNTQPEDSAPDIESQLQEAKDKYLRLFAEFDNYKKRTSKERIMLIQTASEDLVKDLLVVLDDFERAKNNLDENSDVTAVLEGLELVYNKLFGVLKQRGLEAISVENGEFNSDLHEAITEIPASSEEAKGKIVDVVEKGYYLKDKIIRHAKVVVGK